MDSIPDPNVEGRVCNKCGLWKPIKSFQLQKKCPGGRGPRCAKCSVSPEARKAQSKRYYERHKERKKAYNKAYLAAHRTEEKAYRRAYYVANKDRMLEQNRQHRQELIAADPEAFYEPLRIQSREYRKNNKEKFRESMHNTMARRMQAPGRWAKEQWAALLEHYGAICLRCGSVERICRDHVIPLTKGGRNDIANLQPLCRTCNTRKNQKSTDYRPDAGEFAFSLMSESDLALLSALPAPPPPASHPKRARPAVQQVTLDLDFGE